ncbi:MAG: ABC transporter permease [Campylobacterales bacterium]|nr:ABC transporter permease [Campylobacterales bacterium]
MFKTAFQLAYKSLFRRATRTSMVVLMIALSLSGLLLLQGLYDGMVTHMINTTLRSDCGEISLYAKNYRLEQDLKYHIDDIPQLQKSLDQIKEIDTYAIRLSQQGLIATAHKSFQATLKGISLEQEKTFGQLDRFLFQGVFDFGKKDENALIGEILAKNLKVGLGSRLVFSAQDANGEINAISFRIGGILKTGNPLIDEETVLIPMKKMSNFLSLPDSATQIALRVYDPSSVKPLQKILQNRLKDLEVYRWDELYPLLIQMRQMMDLFNLISYIIVFIVAALGIFGVILVSILERMREFSVMLAIGASHTQIRLQVILEAFIMALFGYTLGSLLGWFFLIYTASIGIDLGYFEAGLQSFGLGSVLFADIHGYYFLEAFGAVVTASLLSSLWPLYLLKKIDPIRIIQGKML